MFRRIAALGVAFLAGLAASVASAEDIEVIEAPELDFSARSTAATGWYVRGDLGYAGWVTGGKPSYTTYLPDGAVFSRETFDSARFSEPFSYGVGVGYQFNSLLRADLTTDFFKGRLDGTSDMATPCSGAEPAGTSCRFTHKAGYSAASIMANGYVDLATFMGITPYIGAGAGATHLDWDDLQSTATCQDGSAACSGTGQAGATLPGHDTWRFTYALMAGASYDISDRIKIDFGYRFSDLGGGRMFGSGAADGAVGRDDGFRKHEFRIGIRVAVW